MAGHNRHVLEMAFAAHVAYGAIMGVVQHHAFDDGRAEGDCLRIVNGNPRLFFGRCHARHHDFPRGVLFILELFDSALAAGAYRT